MSDRKTGEEERGEMWGERGERGKGGRWEWRE